MSVIESKTVIAFGSGPILKFNNQTTGTRCEKAKVES